MPRSIDNLRNINSQYSRTEGLVLLVQNLFEEAINKMVLLASKSDYNGDNQFYFEDYPDLYKQAQNVVNKLAFDVTTLIGSSTSDAWMRANKEQDTFVKEVLNQAGINDLDSLTPSAVHRYFNNHEQALASFQKRKIGGLGLSQRVWNYAENARLETQLGVSISSAISEGKSASELAKEVKQYLNEPNKLFRRVRDKFGVLRLSKPAKKYHPGAGVYRSSYRNALRLARNEINMAYRVAEGERWQGLDFVIGIEIKRSIYSNEKGSRYNCDDVCERLKGRYPKDFNFVGWHVNCRCYAVPILCSKEEMRELTKRIIKNEPTDNMTFEGEVTETPHNFGEWISDNSTRIKDAEKEGRLPYFIRENIGYAENFIDADLSETKPIFGTPDTTIGAVDYDAIREQARIRHESRTEEQIDDIMDRWMTRKAGMLDFMDSQYYDDLLFDDTAELWNTLDDRMKEILANYTGSDYEWMNYRLRKGNFGFWVNSENKAEATQKIKDMTDVLYRYKTPIDMWVSRGISGSNMFATYAEMGEIADQTFDISSLVGRTFEDKGFLSTGVGTNGFRGREVQMRILVPQGSHGIYANHFSEITGNGAVWDGIHRSGSLGGEQEFILQRGGKYRVLKAEYVNDQLVVTCYLRAQRPRK